MNSGIRLSYETMREIDATTLTANYALIGTIFENPIRILLLQNTSDAGVRIALDGTRDFMYLSPSTSIIVDVTSNKSGLDNGLFVSARSGVYVKHDGTVPTSGDVFVTAMYGHSV